MHNGNVRAATKMNHYYEIAQFKVCSELSCVYIRSINSVRNVNKNLIKSVLIRLFGIDVCSAFMVVQNLRWTKRW